MKITELDNNTLFEFESDLYIDAAYVAHFDTSQVDDVIRLLKEHGIWEFDARPGVNEKHQRTVTIHVFNELPQAFHYDLSTLLMTWRTP